MKLYSIYYSLDGEYNCFQGAGQPSMFLRLQGCNLRCEWCDTVRAQGYGPNLIADIDASVEKIMQHYIPMEITKFTITGGEPLLQMGEVLELCQQLVKRNGKQCQITIETNGSMKPRQGFCNGILNTQTRFVFDYKLASSGMTDQMHPELFNFTYRQDAIKFVIGNFEDYQQMMGLINKVNCVPVISAVPKLLTKVADQVLKDYETNLLPPRTLFNLQLHKVLWPDTEKEV